MNRARRQNERIKVKEKEVMGGKRKEKRAQEKDEEEK